MIKKIFIITILATAFFTIFFPDNASAEKKKNRRPRIGLVLSGGGAKGIAHIGVLKVLDKIGLQVDYIAGTSMGSIIGGLYSIGYRAELLERLVNHFDWDDLLEDKISRRSTSVDEKEDHTKYIGAFPIRKLSIELPKGYKRGQKLSSLLSQLTLHVQHIKNFNKLPTPFRCIGTDIVTGKAIVIKEGILSDAMRASMSIPSIFTPIDVNGHLMVDGGVIRNLPVTDARDMGADIIIAVDVGAPLYKRDELKSLFEIMDQSVSFLGAASTKKQRLKSDILIIPNIKGFSGSDFNKGKKLIAIGEEAARLAMPQLKALVESQKKYPHIEKNHIQIIFKEKMFIEDVEIKGLKRVSKGLVRGKLLLNTPTMVTPDELTNAIARVYASRFFERVSYEIKPGEGGGVILVIHVIEDTTTFLKVGLSYDSDMYAAILANITLRNLLGQGSKLAVDLRLSKDPGAKLTYSISSGWRKPGVNFSTILRYDKYDIFTYEKGNKEAQYDYHNYGIDLILQLIIYNSFAIGGGVQKDFTNIDSQIVPDDPVKKDIEGLNYYGFLKFDNLDRTLYPRSGIQFYAEVKYLTDDLCIMKKRENFSPFYRMYFKMKGYIPFHKKFTAYIGCSLGHIFGKEPYYPYIDLTGVSLYRRKIPFIFMNYIGGLHTYKKDCYPFSGLKFMQISGKHIWTAALGFQIEPVTDFFIILRGNIARSKEKFSNLFRKKNLVRETIYGVETYRYENFRNDLIYGYGLTLGLNTIIGPIEISLMKGSESKQFLLHLNIGYRI